jgi:hypothetical protein
VNEKLPSNSQIAEAFLTYGQDFRSNDQSDLLAYLAKHEENGVYRSLINNQQAIDME